MATTFHRIDSSGSAPAAEIIRIVHALEGISLAASSVEAILARLSRSGAVHVWVIEHDGATAGYMLVEIHPRNGFLWREASIVALYVRPVFRQRGIASKARVLAREEALQLGACLRWRQLHREDAPVITDQDRGTVLLSTMVAA